jgi:hypothetical protein
LKVIVTVRHFSGNAPEPFCSAGSIFQGRGVSGMFDSYKPYIDPRRILLWKNMV